MPGLLDARGGFDDPITMGLLGASQALLTPMSQGGGLGAAFGAFPAAQQAALKNKYLQQQMEDQQVDSRLKQLQMAAAIKKLNDENTALDYMSKRMGGWNPSAGDALSAEAQAGGQLGPTKAAAAQLQTGGGEKQFPFSIGEVNMLTRLGIPGLMEQYKFFNTPQELRAGSVAINRNTGQQTFNPAYEKGTGPMADGSVGVLPGYLDAITQITQNQKKAEAPFGAPIRTTDSQGREVLMRPDQFIYATGGLGAPSLPGARLQTPGAYPQTQGAPSLPGASPTSFGGLVMGQTDEDRGREKSAVAARDALNASWIKTSDKIIEDGANASKSITDMQLLRSMDLNTGIGVEKQAWAANLLRSVHPSFEQYAAKAERFGTIATDTTLQKQLEQAGVATKSDTELAAKVGPAISKTPEANAFAIDYIEAVARVKEQKARYYQMMRAAAQESGESNLSTIDRRWAKLQQTNPALSVFGQPTMQRWKP